MEINNSMDEQQSSPFSRWCDSHSRPPQSQWLHSTLSELDEKIKTILDLIEDNGDTFAERAEMYYQKRPQLIKTVKELHRSYRALADKYDKLKSECSIKASHNGSISNSFRKPQSLQDCAQGKPKPRTNTSVDAPNFSSESISELSAAGSKSGSSSFEFHSPKSFMSFDCASDKLMDEGESKCCNDKKNDLAAWENGWMIKEKVWDEQMKFSKLLEENLSKQAELIRRNDEKREVINALRNENRILSQKSSDGSSDDKGRMKGTKECRKRKLRGFFCFA